ncbi:MAG: hypothetical protein KY466_11140, partial [Gemmatimonadetes bacterium]|nr:hypothetical protein [Gemmatimonadota bacterium]
EGRVGEGERLFISDGGEERRYRFASEEPHDATLEDLRDQLGRSESAGTRTGSAAEGPAAR